MNGAINIRIPKAEKDRLKGIAAIAGLSLSAFLRASAITEAYRVLGSPRLVSSHESGNPSR